MLFSEEKGLTGELVIISTLLRVAELQVRWNTWAKTVFWFISTATDTNWQVFRALTKGLYRYFVLLRLYFDANVRHTVKSVVSEPGTLVTSSVKWGRNRFVNATYTRARAMKDWQRHSDEVRASSRARSPSALLSAWWCCRKEERGISHHATLLFPRDGRTDRRMMFEVTEALSRSRFGSFEKRHRIRLNRTLSGHVLTN